MKWREKEEGKVWRIRTDVAYNVRACEVKVWIKTWQWRERERGRKRLRNALEMRMDGVWRKLNYYDDYDYEEDMAYS